MKAGPEVKPPLLVKQVDPDLTRKMRKRPVQTQVLVHVVIDEHGVPQNVHVEPHTHVVNDEHGVPQKENVDASASVTGDGLDQEFESSALKAVQRWRFEPAMYEGKPVAVELNIQVSFQILPKP